MIRSVRREGQSDCDGSLVPYLPFAIFFFNRNNRHRVTRNSDCNACTANPHELLLCARARAYVCLCAWVHVCVLARATVLTNCVLKIEHVYP